MVFILGLQQIIKKSCLSKEVVAVSTAEIKLEALRVAPHVSILHPPLPASRLVSLSRRNAAPVTF